MVVAGCQTFVIYPAEPLISRFGRTGSVNFTEPFGRTYVLCKKICNSQILPIDRTERFARTYTTRGDRILKTLNLDVKSLATVEKSKSHLNCPLMFGFCELKCSWRRCYDLVAVDFGLRGWNLRKSYCRCTDSWGYYLVDAPTTTICQKTDCQTNTKVASRSQTDVMVWN